MFQIPAYVYVLFCVLVYLGARRCFPRSVRPERTLVFPLAFLALGATSLHRLFPDARFAAQGLALTLFVLGAAIGWVHASRWRLRFARTSEGLEVTLPGDPTLLATLLLSFSIKFAQNYALAIHASWAATHAFEWLSFAAWGALAGMPLGRSANVLARAARAKQPAAPSPSFE